MDAILLHRETSIRRALILALGTYPPGDLAPELLKPWTSSFLEKYRSDPDCGIHGALDWTLRQWGRQDEVRRIDSELRNQAPPPDRRWYVNSQGQTLAIVEGPVEFTMGSPPTEPHHLENERLHRRIIPRRFSIATTEVTPRAVRGVPQGAPGGRVVERPRVQPGSSGPCEQA